MKLAFLGWFFVGLNTLVPLSVSLANFQCKALVFWSDKGLLSCALALEPASTLLFRGFYHDFKAAGYSVKEVVEFFNRIHPGHCFDFLSI